jgi:2-polyprenyl-6-methoxyphenol hydroxylase-like FAD-dependent oxidoreductase
VLLVEHAPHLRSGGYIIDFWGIGYEIADRMGLVPRIRERGYQVREVRFCDAHGRKVGGFGTDVFARTTGGRFTSVRRSDLSAIVYEALAGKVQTLFGDSVTRLHEGPQGVGVEFAHAAPRQFDLVVGTDGLHSRVRELVFGPEARPRASRCATTRRCACWSSATNTSRAARSRPMPSASRHWRRYSPAWAGKCRRCWRPWSRQTISTSIA